MWLHNISRLLAVLVADFSDKFGLINNCYSDLFPHAEDHGLAQVVIVHSQANLVQVDAIRKTDYSKSPSRIFLIGEIWKAAEHIARYQLGPPARNVIIKPDSLGLSNDDHLLLRRPFSDCERVYLEPLVGGKASAGVFCAHAWLRKSQVGPRPLPFFVKIATPQLVNAEKSKYGLYAEHYIPFNLRPNLDLRRCVCTRPKAAIVGNFVDDAVPLRRSLRSGHGVGAVFDLRDKLERVSVAAVCGQRKAKGECAGGVCKRSHSVGRDTSSNERACIRSA